MNIPELPLFQDSNVENNQIKSNNRIVTGYTIYNAEQKRRKKRNDLPDLYPDLPLKKYEIIYADPPWDYQGKMQFDRSGKGIGGVDIEKRIFISAANFKYPTLKLEELQKIPILDIAKEDSLLFMWVTNPHLKIGIELGETWGFKYRTVAFVWDKLNHNPGHYTLSNCELCLVFKHGKIPSSRAARNVEQLVRVKRGMHSEKPAEVRERIDRMFNTEDKIELFARHKPNGWDVWGLDVREIYEVNN